MKCQGCGIDKNLADFEKYPYEEDGLCEDPIEPLLLLEIQPESSKEWKKALVCHECFHKLSPDMWIGEICWKKINPVIPFSQL